MSDKITSKNLSYDTALPPFLAALHTRAAGSSGSPDAILAARRRPGKARSGSEEAEDAPLVVDEGGNVVDVTISKDGSVNPAKEDEGQSKDNEESKAADTPREVEKTASIGGGKKRKAGKVVGSVVDGDKRPEKPESTTTTVGGTVSKPKKGKKIKLSFDPE